MVQLSMGSHDSLGSLDKRQANVAVINMLDGEGDACNVGFVKKLLPNVPAIVLHFYFCMQSLYLANGNPKGIHFWTALGRSEVAIINREYGTSACILLDENLSMLNIYHGLIQGYDRVNRFFCLSK
ncbi:MAG: substrate-binding domain-containing protein [Ethanoligenens sp.]